MSFPRFFQSNILDEKFLPEEILCELKKIYEVESQRMWMLNRDVQLLRIDLLKLLIDQIEMQLQKGTKLFCNFLLMQFFYNNIQQTQNYIRWNNLKSLSFGNIHLACAQLFPTSFVNALVILRARESKTIKRIYINIDPESHKEYELHKIKLVPREKLLLSDILYGVSHKIILEHPFIKLLMQEIDWEKKFLNLNLKNYHQNCHALILDAKALHNFHNENSWNVEKINAFKNKLINFSEALTTDALLFFNEYIIFLDLMTDLIQQGMFLSKKMIEVVTKPTSIIEPQEQKNLEQLQF